MRFAIGFSGGRKYNGQINMKKIVLYICLCLIVGISIWFFSNEHNRAAFGSSGYIKDGSKFGVEIGADRQVTINFLIAKGFIDSTVSVIKETHYDPQSCHNRKYKEGIKVDSFWDEGWRGATICLASESGIVIGMSWDYNMFAP